MAANRILPSLVASVVLASSLSAWAQPAPNRDPGSQHGGAPQQPAPQQRGAKNAPAPQAQRGPQHAPAPVDTSRRNDRDTPAPGQWKQGDRMPAEYRGHQYVVNDPQAHGLRKPPRGQQWVDIGGQYFLVAAATGIITSLIVNANR